MLRAHTKEIDLTERKSFLKKEWDYGGKEGGGGIGEALCVDAAAAAGFITIPFFLFSFFVFCCARVVKPVSLHEPFAVFTSPVYLI